MTSLLMKAAQSAAQADGLVAPSPSGGSQNDGGEPSVSRSSPMNTGGGGGVGGKKKGPPLRRGKWTAEEEAYANRLIQEFKAGLLPLTDGTTLRTFLSKLLNCDPMRISKKFVGSNCIGKQVFRRRTADLNRLTPEQIQQSRVELSELERRFLERVAQTNRVKSSGVGGATVPPGGPAAVPSAGNTSGQGLMGAPDTQLHQQQQQQNSLQQQQQALNQLQRMGGAVAAGNNMTNPPWLQPPMGYKQGAGAAFAAANLSSANSRAAAAGRALLGGFGGNNPNGDVVAQFKETLERKLSGNALAAAAAQQQMNGGGGAGFLAELQRRASQQSLLQNFGNTASASDVLAAAAARNAQGNNSNSAMVQLAQSASAARMAGLAGGASTSMNNLMLKTGLSRDQLSQLARDRGLSSNSLSDLIQRQNSFDALMSLDFQSLQSIDNLANLIQTGGGGVHVPESGMKNADFGSASRPNFAVQSSGELSQAARRLASAGRMESLLRSLSSNNMRGNADSGGGSTVSNANLQNLLQSMQGNMNAFGNNSNSNMGFNAGSAASLLGGGNIASAVSLANLLRQDSSTGLTALRLQDGLNQRNSSVDDFLSLVAAGDIPHQDPSLLNVPLMQQQGGGGGQSSHEAAVRLLAQQHMLQQAGGNAALANALASRSFGTLSQSNLHSSTSVAALAMAQARAASTGSKRKLDELAGGFDPPGDNKR